MGSLFGANAIDTRTSMVEWLVRPTFFSTFVKRQLECSSICILHQCVKIYRDNFFGVQGSLNKIEKYVKFDPTGSGFDSRGMKL
jgi:hypothetical protein